eukprot:Amastigsp_a12689_6.p2 type:complete len:125 gc:universal Amastigsp_a12689_6:146-520(+)
MASQPAASRSAPTPARACAETARAAVAARPGCQKAAARGVVVRFVWRIVVVVVPHAATERASTSPAEGSSSRPKLGLALDVNNARRKRIGSRGDRHRRRRSVTRRHVGGEPDADHGQRGPQRAQ